MKRKLLFFAIMLVLCVATLCTGTAAFAAGADSSGVSLYSCPDKTVYVAGEALDPAGAQILVDGQIIDVTGDMLGEVSTAQTGVKKVEVHYAGAIVSFEIEVVENYVIQLSIKTKPEKLSFAPDEEFSAAGGVLSAVWFDGTQTEVSMTDDNVSLSGYRPTVAGRQLITVAYEGGVASYYVQAEGGAAAANGTKKGCGSAASGSLIAAAVFTVAAAAVLARRKKND